MRHYEQKGFGETTKAHQLIKITVGEIKHITHSVLHLSPSLASCLKSTNECIGFQTNRPITKYNLTSLTLFLIRSDRHEIHTLYELTKSWN